MDGILNGISNLPCFFPECNYVLLILHCICIVKKMESSKKMHHQNHLTAKTVAIPEYRLLTMHGFNLEAIDRMLVWQ